MDLLGAMYFIICKKLCYIFDLPLAFKVTKPQDQIIRLQSPALTLADTELPSPKKIKSKPCIFQDEPGVCISYPPEGAHGVPRSSPKSSHQEGNAKEKGWGDCSRDGNVLGVARTALCGTTTRLVGNVKASLSFNGWNNSAESDCQM